jgi:hypothetical protein
VEVPGVTVSALSRNPEFATVAAGRGVNGVVSSLNASTLAHRLPPCYCQYNTGFE